MRARRGLAFERTFIAEARRANRKVETEDGWPDIAFTEGSAKVAVDIKGDLYTLSTSRLRAFFADTERRRDADGYALVFIVSPRPPSPRVRGIETDKVKIASPNQVLRVRQESIALMFRVDGAIV